MNKQNHKQLKEFLKEMDYVKNSRDLILIIVENKKLSPGDEFWQKLGRFSRFVLGNSFISEKLIEKIVGVQKSGKSLVVDIKADPHPKVIGVLKEISRFGRISFYDKKDNLKKTLEISSAVKIIAVAERSFIEEKITYRNFYNLFDTAFIL